jgi:hypothetical protein
MRVLAMLVLGLVLAGCACYAPSRHPEKCGDPYGHQQEDTGAYRGKMHKPGQKSSSPKAQSPGPDFLT